MRLFTMEHSRAAYLADFALYGLAVLSFGASLLALTPRVEAGAVLALTLIGLASWTALEYALHRFILHGLRPFSTWHAEHHRRPAALICTPTVVSATLIGALVFLPAWLLLGDLHACALTFGVLIGYLAYAITHHAIHHWHGGSLWLQRRKRWHALHHHRLGPAECYGVTSGLFDTIFKTGPHVVRHQR